MQFCEQFGFQRGLEFGLHTVDTAVETVDSTVDIVDTVKTVDVVWLHCGSTDWRSEFRFPVTLCSPELDTVSLLFTRRAPSGNQIICLRRQAVLYVI